jgi:hypothetical protein
MRALVLIAAVAGLPDEAKLMSEMNACVDRSARRVERLQDDLESVARIVVNVACLEPLTQLTRRVPRGEVPDLIRLYEVAAILAALRAREERLGQ